MKKHILMLIVSAIYATAAFAAPKDYDIRFTVHNMAYNTDPANGLTNDVGPSSTRQWFATSNPADNQVCIFCHTPHNASPARPLWNKVMSSTAYTAFKLYTSSQTLTSTVKKSAFLQNSESLLCLSCHDGKTAVNVVHNTRTMDGIDPATGKSIIDVNGWSEPLTLWANGNGTPNVMNIGAIRVNGIVPTDASYNTGTNLTDDHPLGFSYAQAYAETSSSLHDINYAKNQGIRFFGPNRDRLECSSCHNTHVFYGSSPAGSTRVVFDGTNGPVATAQQAARTPFLVMGNNGSALCLACHIK